MIASTVVNDFERCLPDRVLTPTHAEFDQVRKVYNGVIDRKPALIARCQSTRDVAETVRLAREHDIPVSIRGGGHNMVGKAVLQDGLMIDLSGMKAIRVDAERGVARARRGSNWGSLMRRRRSTD